MRLVAIAIVLMLLAVPATAMAAGPGGHRPAAAGAGADAADAEGEDRAFGGLPEKAMFGICNAWMKMQKGREMGQAGSAPPFQWLQDQAGALGQAVDAFCAGYARPGSP